MVLFAAGTPVSEKAMEPVTVTCVDRRQILKKHRNFRMKES
jgi:hypothetical protein